MRELVEEKNGRNKKKKNERKRGIEKRKRKKDGKGEKIREPIASSSDLRCSDGRSSLGRELKFVYSMKATLQEVGILPTLVYFHPKRLFGWICFMMRLSCLDPTLCL